ncbi:MAG: class I SAM-dependent methyltransferase, partial [Flavobacteriales bacterium]|nr:class I SAM-dependent methyltransferase [Flavobacteriales bacterium]
HDIAKLDGVDVIHDLEQFPWPFEDNSFEKIYMKDVLEHLSNTIKTLEEIHRIAKPGCEIFIAVPYWNSWEAITDPTHKKNFNEFTFEFFDPSKWRCQDRPYYSKARFKIKKQGYYIALFQPYLKIPFIGRERVVFNKFAKWILGFFATYFSNIIIGLDIYLEKTDYEKAI